MSRKRFERKAKMKKVQMIERELKIERIPSMRTNNQNNYVNNRNYENWRNRMGPIHTEMARHAKLWKFGLDTNRNVIVFRTRRSGQVKEDLWENGWRP